MNIINIIKYYFGIIFFKIVYVEEKEIINKDGEKDTLFSGYILSHRKYTNLIVSILMFPLVIINCILQFIISIITNIFDYFTIYESKIITDKKNMTIKQKVKLYNSLKKF